MKVYSDNDVLKIVQKIDEDKPVDYTMDLPEFSTDTILNWNKQPNKKTIIHEIISQLDELVKNNISLEEAIEILESKFKEEDLLPVLKELKKAIERNQDSYEEPEEDYDEVKDSIENLVLTTSPETFVDILTAKDNPEYAVVRCKTKEKIGLKNAARGAQEYEHNQPFIEEIHKIIRPFVEDEIKLSKLTAKKLEKLGAIVEKKDKNFIVMIDDDIYIVDLKEFKCDCDRFNKSNFASLHIPCEHIIMVRNTFKPKNNNEKNNNKKNNSLDVIVPNAYYITPDDAIELISAAPTDEKTINDACNNIVKLVKEYEKNEKNEKSNQKITLDLLWHQLEKNTRKVLKQIL